MKELSRFLSDSASSGVYAAPADIRPVAQQARACGLAWLELDLSRVADKAGFLALLQRVFELPASFGQNWDAAADVLGDLSWLPARGYVVHCCHGAEFARRSRADFSTAIAILAGAAGEWRMRGGRFLVLLDEQTARESGLAMQAFPA